MKHWQLNRLDELPACPERSEDGRNEVLAA
jgi:hypothetical protein